MTKAEVSWYDEDDHCEVEEDLDLVEDTVNQKKKIKGVQCPKCKKVLSQKQSLATHLRSVRPCTIPKPPKKTTQIKYKPSQCPECKKVFTQRLKAFGELTEQFSRLLPRQLHIYKKHIFTKLTL